MADSQRVLVTGAAGFIGSHLLHLLLAKGIRVAALIRPESDCWRIRHLLPDVVKIDGDLRELGAVEEAVRDFRPGTFIHLAWYGVGNSYRNDPLQVMNNLQSSLELLHLAQRVGCQTFIGLGSQAEYGPLSGPVDESATPSPTTLYGTTKLCAYLLGQQLAGQLGIRFIWLRLFSAYGPMDNPGWMIPSLILRLLGGERPALTKGTQQWDYVFVNDVADAIYALMMTPGASGVFNLGSGQAHTIRSIVEQIRDLIDPALPLGFGEVPFRDDQVMHLEADITRLRREASWSPQVRLPDGIAKTVEWYREHRERFNV
jgi:nucleoside-diphosphate-sugar epimerase